MFFFLFFSCVVVLSFDGSLLYSKIILPSSNWRQTKKIQKKHFNCLKWQTEKATNFFLPTIKPIVNRLHSPKLSSYKVGKLDLGTPPTCLTLKHSSQSCKEIILRASPSHDNLRLQYKTSYVYPASLLRKTPNIPYIVIKTITHATCKATQWDCGENSAALTVLRGPGYISQKRCELFQLVLLHLVLDLRGRIQVIINKRNACPNGK